MKELVFIQAIITDNFESLGLLFLRACQKEIIPVYLVERTKTA